MLGLISLNKPANPISAKWIVIAKHINMYFSYVLSASIDYSLTLVGYSWSEFRCTPRRMGMQVYVEISFLAGAGQKSSMLRLDKRKIRRSGG